MTSAVSPTQLPRAWLIPYLLVEVGCDAPIVEALLWSQQWALLPHIHTHGPFLMFLNHNYEANLTRVSPYDLIIDYGDERKVIARWNSTAQALEPLTEYDRAVVQALGYSMNPPEYDALTIAVTDATPDAIAVA